jgi:hypothetical protein
MPSCVLCMVVSRKFSVLLCSVSAVNFRFGCRALKSARMVCMLASLESKIMSMSSTKQR